MSPLPEPLAGAAAPPAEGPAAAAAGAPPAWPGGWNRLWRVLVVHSVGDLLRYKSFLLLVAALLVLDRAVHVWLPRSPLRLAWPHWANLTVAQAQALFDAAPGQVLRLLLDWRTLLGLLLAFALKEAVSLWPTSDMRLMHRRQRSHWGVLHALSALRWSQVAWDFIAVASLILLAAAWGAAAFALCRLGMARWPSLAWLAVGAAVTALVGPLVFAGLSYSSKLAVLSRGGFGRKLALYFRLFWDWSLLWPSWLFCLVRMSLEGLLTLAVPLWALTTIGNFWLRLAVASLVAAPAYSYVKMAGFKFFLEVYRRYPEVWQEYREYYVRTGLDDAP